MQAPVSTSTRSPLGYNWKGRSHSSSPGGNSWNASPRKARHWQRLDSKSQSSRRPRRAGRVAGGHPAAHYRLLQRAAGSCDRRATSGLRHLRPSRQFLRLEFQRKPCALDHSSHLRVSSAAEHQRPAVHWIRYSRALGACVRERNNVGARALVLCWRSPFGSGFCCVARNYVLRLRWLSRFKYEFRTPSAVSGIVCRTNLIDVEAN